MRQRQWECLVGMNNFNEMRENKEKKGGERETERGGGGQRWPLYCFFHKSLLLCSPLIFIMTSVGDTSVASLAAP